MSCNKILDKNIGKQMEMGAALIFILTAFSDMLPDIIDRKF